MTGPALLGQDQRIVQGQQLLQTVVRYLLGPTAGEGGGGKRFQRHDAVHQELCQVVLPLPCLPSSNSPRRYFKERNAAGVVSLSGGGEEFQGLMYLFPPCVFVEIFLSQNVRGGEEEEEEEDNKAAGA
eukprot:766696-Hanusia_phi.AAC.6